MTAKEENAKLKQMYDKLITYEQQMHERNQKRIKIGLRCIWIIPMFFLFLMFVTGSSEYRIVFLVFWIGSLFGIAVYLIGVEYADYKLQEKLHEIHGDKDIKVEGLIDIEDIEEKVQQAVEKIETRGGLK